MLGIVFGQIFGEAKGRQVIEGSVKIIGAECEVPIVAVNSSSLAECAFGINYEVDLHAAAGEPSSPTGKSGRGIS